METLFLFYLPVRSRFATPRQGTFIKNDEHNLWLYKGRPLTLDEFNEAAEAVLDELPRGSGINSPKPTVRMIQVDVSASPTPEPSPPTEAPQEDSPPAEPEPSDPVPEAADPDGGQFHFDGRNILLGGERVGGLYDPGDHLRMAHGRTDLREEVEKWLESQPKS